MIEWSVGGNMKDRDHEHEEREMGMNSGQSNWGTAIGCRFPSARPSPGLVTGSPFPDGLYHTA